MLYVFLSFPFQLHDMLRVRAIAFPCTAWNWKMEWKMEENESAAMRLYGVEKEEHWEWERGKG